MVSKIGKFPGMPDISDKRPIMLFVDDRTKRIHYALDVLSKDYRITIATCVPEALRQMSTEFWDYISLDHDLNGHDFEDPDTPTCGMEIVRYLQKCGGWPKRSWADEIIPTPPRFIIHSSNLFAAHLMVTSLLRLGLDAQWKKITYPVEHMQYDEKGIPK